MEGTYWLVFATLVAGVFGQLSNWQEGQINTSVCLWQQPRATIIRDVIYLDGGSLWWSAGLDDGSVVTSRNDGNFAGTILTYNLSIPFDATTNVSGILTENTKSKAIGGEGNSNGAAPNYYDGGLLSNDAQFFLFGGAVFENSAVYETPDAEDVLKYEAYQYGEEKPLWQAGFVPDSLGDDVTRFVAYGGAVSAPSENKAWYFSGMVSPDGGNIASNPDPDGSDRAQNITQTMVQVDMETQYDEKWTIMDLPDGVEGRANAEVVWVPVGEQGILVVLGGVTHPEWETVEHQSEDEEASEEESPKFMETIDIYDIANDEWYNQPTEGDSPGARTRGCAVVAAASDYSSFNIYYYGGYDGLHVQENFYDDVWVLSLPSFTWTQINEGTNIHARAGHKCFTPYPDQMMAFGGGTHQSGSSNACLDQGPVVIFNLTSGEWMDSYHPDEHSDYGVPDKVVEQIGGDASGGATVTEPADGWETDALGDLFSSSYDMDKISTWYPYEAAATDSGRPDLPDDTGDEDDGGSGGSGLPSWVAPVLGVVLGLMVITGAIVLFCLYRRRKYLKSSGTSEAETEDAGIRILSWIKGQGGTEKATTTTIVTSEDTPAPASPQPAQFRAIDGAVSPSLPTTEQRHEAAGTPIAELDACTPPTELDSIFLSHQDVLNKHSGSLSNQQRAFSFATTTDISNPSGDAGSGHGSRSRIISPTVEETSEASSSSNAPQIGLRGGAAHLPMQSLSETMASGESQPPVAKRGSSEQPVETPISPPTNTEVQADDYVSARNDMVSPVDRPSIDEKVDLQRK